MDSDLATIAVCNLSVAQQQAVRDTLVFILESPYFSKSKRYPALLEFLVLSTLDGTSGALKERTVGIEVFGRSHTYDPSTDPVVRVATGEVRKRLALYFSEHPEALVRIELPLGHYTAEFHFRSSAAADIVPDDPKPESAFDLPEAEPISESVQVPPKPFGKLASRSAIAAVVLVLLGGIAYWHYVRNAAHPDFWSGVLRDDVPAVVVVGEFSTTDSQQTSAAPSTASGASTPSSSSTGGGTTMANAFTAGQVCNVFERYNRPCDMVSSDRAELANLQNKTVILIGRDNEWTQRLLTPLPYRFESNQASTPGPNSEYIADQSSSANRLAWRIGPNPHTDTDYAIVGRFHSDITDSTAVVAAGLTPTGTLGAEQFISSSEDMQRLLAKAPKGWKGFNFEAVLQMDVIQNTPGDVKLVQAKFW